MTEDILCCLSNCRGPAVYEVLFTGHTRVKYYCRRHVMPMYGGQGKHVWTSDPHKGHQRKVEHMEVLGF